MNIELHPKIHRKQFIILKTLKNNLKTNAQKCHHLWKDHLDQNDSLSSLSPLWTCIPRSDWPDSLQSNSICWNSRAGRLSYSQHFHWMRLMHWSQTVRCLAVKMFSDDYCSKRSPNRSSWTASGSMIQLFQTRADLNHL